MVLVVLVAVLAVLGVAVCSGDRAARAAETELGRRVDAQLGYPADTTQVEFLGDWFLLQAAQGGSSVAVTSPAPFGGVSAPVSDGLLHDVQVPVLQLVQEQSGTVTVGSAEAAVDLGWEAADALLAAPGAR